MYLVHGKSWLPFILKVQLMHRIKLLRFLILLFSVSGLLALWILGFEMMLYRTGDDVKWLNHLPAFLVFFGSLLYVIFVGMKLRKMLRISQ